MNADRRVRGFDIVLDPDQGIHLRALAESPTSFRVTAYTPGSAPVELARGLERAHLERLRDLAAAMLSELAEEEGRPR